MRVQQRWTSPGVTRNAGYRAGYPKWLLGSRGLDATVESVYKLFTDHVQPMCKYLHVQHVI